MLLNIGFLISQTKHMLRVLKRTVYRRCVFLSIQNNIHNFTLKGLIHLDFAEVPVLFLLQCSSFITLCLWSKGMDCVISKRCYKGTSFKRNYRKMTISWSFSYNSFLKFHGKKNWGFLTLSGYIQSRLILRCVIKRLHCAIPNHFNHTKII